jgi:NADPH:quinone reductase
MPRATNEEGVLLKSIRFHEFGGPEVLKLEEVDDPKPGTGQALVRVYAAGVNPTDVTTRRGGAAQAPKLPASLGRDASGVVEAIGSGVKTVKSGDKVIVRGGAANYAELTAVSEDDLYPVPDGVGPIDAASIGVTYSTAWDAVVNKAKAGSGQWVLVQGASGGVGVAAVQIAKAVGARVIGTASTAEKRAWVEAQGADHMVDYTQDDWPQQVKDLTGGKGVDAIIDGVGGDSFLRGFECIAPDGNVCVFGASGGREIQMNIASIFRNRIHIHGCGGSGSSREDFEKMLGMFSTGKLKATVETTLPLADAAQAHQMIEDRKVIGKIVLKVG